MRVFFYGLFMDASLLAGKGIVSADVKPAFVDGYELRIGERATLAGRPGSRAYGVVMDIASDKVDELYAEKSVADYEPEILNVQLMDDTQVEATCYNLPGDKVQGFSKEYADALVILATRLQFPASYLEEIRQAGNVPPKPVVR